MKTTLVEVLDQSLSEATTVAPDGFPIQILTPGWGSSGYYSAAVCEAAAPLVPAGTLMYLDHPTRTDQRERPERSVRDIAAILSEGARWDPAGQRLVGWAVPVAQYKGLIEDLGPHIGLSIQGSATDVHIGEAEGRTGPIVDGIAAIDSVDFVTRAGRGGRVLGLMESAAAPDRAVARGVAEATVNDTRERLDVVIKARFGGEKQWAGVRDFDDSTVWFYVNSPDADALFELPYTIDTDGVVTLSADAPVEVRATTLYVPVTRPGATNTTESKEDTSMGNIEIEEAEYQRLVTEAGRVGSLETERDTALTERDHAQALLAAYRVIETVSESVGVQFDELQTRGLIADLPIVEGAFDEAAFTEAVTKEATRIKESAPPAARILGMGGHITPGTEGVSESKTPTVSPWGRKLEG